MSGQRWRAPAGQLMDAEQQKLLSAAQALARLVTELAAEDTVSHTNWDELLAARPKS